MRDTRRAPTNPGRWWLLFGVAFIALFAASVLAVFYRGWQGEPTDDQLLAAITRGDAAEVRRLLEEGARANAMAVGNKTALAIAVRTGNDEVIRALVEHGASPGPGLVEAVVADRLDILKLLLSLRVLEEGQATEKAPPRWWPRWRTTAAPPPTCSWPPALRST